MNRTRNSYFFLACEDIIVAQISIETVGSLWNWACEPGGSAYVRRHCIAFLRSDFSRICSSHLLFELEEDLLKGCLLSDYVQVFLLIVFISLSLLFLS